MFLGGIKAFGFLLLTLSSDSDVRIQKHLQAVQELQETHFFYEGRGMTLSPDFIDTYELLARVFGLSKPSRAAWGKDPLVPFQSRWGIVDHEKKLKGFFNVEYRGMNVGVLGCVACHSGKAAGQYIVGLGNKNIDPGQVGRDAYRAQNIWKSLHPFKKNNEDYQLVEKNSLDFAKRLNSSSHNNLTQGMVPVALIQRWFYFVAGQEIPENHPRGAVKVPHFWGYGEKRRVGQFSDGMGDGEFAGWGLLVELTGGQSVDGARALMDKASHVEDLLGDILPPAYPFVVDETKAKVGHRLFNSYCSGCHGRYQKDDNDLPIFDEPKFVSLKVVDTDADRANIVTEDFLRLVDKNPLHDQIRAHRKGPGYFAPRLEGIWSRFPYLHNGSVPSIEALLTEPSQRPKVWSLKNVGERDRFDEKNLGLSLPNHRELSELTRSAKNGARDVYDVERVGHSNRGHWFKFSSELDAQQKTSIIEYLKTL